MQPRIPQNPVEMLTRSRNVSEVHNIEEDEEQNDEFGLSSFSVRKLLPRLHAEQLRLYLNRVTIAVENGGPIQQESLEITI